MATTAMDYETANGDRFDGKSDFAYYCISSIYKIRHSTNTHIPLDDGPRYERDQRSASPRASRDDGIDTRRRSASPAANQDR